MAGPVRNVGLRRLRSALAAFRKPLGRDALAPWQAAAQEIGQQAGRLRDLDVLGGELIAPMIAAHPNEQGFTALQSAIAARREQVAAEVRKALAGLLPNQAHEFNGGTLYKRFTPAGPDHAQVAACAGMADYIDLLHDHHGGTETKPSARAGFVHDLKRGWEVDLLQPLLDAVAARNAVRLLGPSDAAVRAPTVALALGRPAEPVAAALAPHGIMAEGGDFYALRPLEAMGVDLEQGVLRVSFVHYTSPAEIDRLLTALETVL